MLVENVSLRGKHKLANKWERSPYIVKAQPDSTVPVYTLKREYGQGPKRTVHRNLLLPIGTTEMSRDISSRRDLSQTKRRDKRDADTTAVAPETTGDSCLSADRTEYSDELSDSSDDGEACVIQTRELVRQSSQLDPLAPEFTPALRADTSLSRSSSLNMNMSENTCIQNTEPEAGTSCVNDSSTAITGIPSERVEHTRNASESVVQPEVDRNESIEPEQIIRRSNRVSKPPVRYTDYIRY